jgi:hypothetical protein
LEAWVLINGGVVFKWGHWLMAAIWINDQNTGRTGTERIAFFLSFSFLFDLTSFLVLIWKFNLFNKVWVSHFFFFIYTIYYIIYKLFSFLHGCFSFFFAMYIIKEACFTRTRWHCANCLRDI